MLKIINPATEQVIATIETDTQTSVAQKFSEAQKAQPQWAALPYKTRKEAIQRFGELLLTHQERLAQILTSEMGKPIAQSRGEIASTEGRLAFFLEQSEKALAAQSFNEPNAKMQETLTWEPLGVIANISAWNYPYFVGTNVFIPALLTGNAVLYKPSEFSSLSGLEMSKLLYEAGVPSAIFAPIIGTGEVGSYLLSQPLNGVFFTGSYATGAKIASAVRDRMIRVNLELGGKDPAYVREDVDVKAAADSLAEGAFYNSGQSCCSIERIYVHASIAEQFIKQFVEAVKGYVTGDPADSKTFVGPLTRSAQLDVLEQQTKDALEKGAKLLLGGKRLEREGYFFEPTVLINVNHTMSVMRDESFGPIIGIQVVQSDEEALALMQDTPYGLTAGVYTQDTAKAKQLLSHIQAGTAYVNCCDRVVPYLPWSGRGHSGLGSTQSFEGIRAFLQPKAWHIRH